MATSDGCIVLLRLKWVSSADSWSADIFGGDNNSSDDELLLDKYLVDIVYSASSSLMDFTLCNGNIKRPVNMHCTYNAKCVWIAPPDDAFKAKIQSVADSLDISPEGSTAGAAVNDADAAMQMFSPLLTSYHIMNHEFNNSYDSITCEDGSTVAFYEEDNFLLIAVTDLSINARHLVRVCFRFMRHIVGPSLTMLKCSVNHSELATLLINTFLSLRQTSQSIVTESMHFLPISEETNSSILIVLQQAVKYLNQCAGIAESKAHILVIKETDIVALYSGKGTAELKICEILFLIIVANAFAHSNKSTRNGLVMLESCVPYSIHIQRVANGLTVVLLIEAGLRAIANNLQTLLNILTSGDKLNEIPKRISELQKSAVKLQQGRWSDGLIWRISAKDNLSARSALARQVKQGFELVCLNPALLFDHIDYVSAVIDRIQFNIPASLFPMPCMLTPLLQLYPGLVHFVLVDRIHHRMISPNLPLERKDSTVADMWKIFHTSLEWLSEGMNQLLWNDKQLCYSHTIWIEDVTNKKLPWKSSGDVQTGLLGYPTVIGGDFYEYTKQGNLKYHTDCAPNNGYYFIPIYDKGEYVIKVVSPNGWSFDPASVSINIDKVTDECTLGKDINFIFKGFTVSGRVYSLSRQTGPAGVILDLIAAEYPAGAVQTVTSEKDGLFAFKGVPPGQYLVRADHVSWSIHPSEVEVEVISDSLTIKERLEVLGYEVHGHVSSEGEPIQGVEFSLYSQNRDAMPSHCGLNAPSVSDRSIVEGWNLVCQTISDVSGRFVYPVVPSGHYKLVPLYSGENILFDITPSSYEFDVEHDSVTLPRKFEVQGFRVSGRVLEHTNGIGLIGAKVFLNDKQVTTTGEGGFYNLENIKTGVYRLTAESANLGFERLSVRISPATPSLPDIVASSFKVCGQVGLSDLPATRHQARKVIFIPSNPSSGDEPILVPTDNAGDFCQLLKPGLYRLEPMALETEVSAGLKFVPSSYEIRVEQKPLSGFRFNQFRASIRGRVNFIGSDQSVPLRLTSISTPVRMPPMDAVTSEGTFNFEKLLPGKYKLAVSRDEWCWKSNSIEVEITDRDLTDVTFNHIGFFLSVSSSHDVDLSYTLNGQTSSEQMKIKAGSSKHCLPQPGRYVFTPKSCHVFEPSAAEWDSSNPTLLVLKSVRHRVGVVVRSDLEIADLQVSATASSDQKTALTLDSVTKAPNGGHEYFFVFDAQSGETFQVTAHADSLLFFPPTLSLSIGRDCDDRAGTIIAQRGLYVSGVIRPAISDVQVTITGGRLAQPATVNTDADGRYSYGPVNLDGHPILDMAATFSLTAEKRGYIIRPDDAFGDFVAEKLAEISVLLVDHSTGQPLPSVLIAAAGGVGYRQNSLTGADGRVTLSGLNPGEYFIKPVLKEYRFDPSSKLVRIEDGDTVEVQIK
nr:EOG090X07YB [Ilyocryptus agilis]